MLACSHEIISVSRIPPRRKGSNSSPIKHLESLCNLSRENRFQAKLQGTLQEGREDSREDIVIVIMDLDVQVVQIDFALEHLEVSLVIVIFIGEGEIDITAEAGTSQAEI